LKLAVVVEIVAQKTPVVALVVAAVVVAAAGVAARFHLDLLVKLM